MSRRFVSSKSEGQSITLIALIMVVLFGMVALSVDVGNTYAQQRDLVRSTNAAALAGMEAYERGGNEVSDSDVADAIIKSFESNGIKVVDKPVEDLSPGERSMTATYIAENGSEHVGCPVGKCTGGAPDNVGYIKVETKGNVDTYFARVVGQDTLPVNTTAHATTCLASENVFPIAVYEHFIDTEINQFADPGDGSYNAAGFASESYPTGLASRKLYLETDQVNKGFSWLKWTNDQQGVAQSLLGFGNLKDGFEEVVPWPDPSRVAPDHYPLTPGELSANDWLYGHSGNPYNAQIRAALDEHRDAGTQMQLPIVSKPTGMPGGNTAYQFVRLGVFFVVDHGDNYIELAYAHEAKEPVCLNTPPIRSKGLQGMVWVKPNWAETGEVRPPINYQVVLDVSGSMSWDFRGYGSNGGTDYLCENNKNNPLGASTAHKCEDGNDSGWKNVEERRIYVAKDAINALIDNMDPEMGDVMRVIAYSTTGLGNDNAEAYPTAGLTGDKDELRDAVKKAGMQWNDPYKTAGSTPGAQGMNAVGKLLEQAPEEFDGRVYKNVVIYLTDGVANVYLNGQRNINCPGFSANEALNTPSCQLGTDDNPGPITQLISEATKVKQNNSDLTLYVVAMAGVAETGLHQVASHRAFFPANDDQTMRNILSDIQVKAEEDQCLAGESNYTNDFSNQDPFSIGQYDAPANGYGYATIRDTAGNVLPNGQGRLPIEYKEALGGVGYLIPQEPGIAPGEYSIEAYVNYRGPDGVVRTYRQLINTDTPNGATSRSFNVPPEDLNRMLEMEPIYLDLPPNVGICSS